MAEVERIGVELTIVVGVADMKLSQILRLTRGAVIPLGRDLSGPIALLANGAPVAAGKVRIVGDRVAVEIGG